MLGTYILHPVTHLAFGLGPGKSWTCATIPNGCGFAGTSHSVQGEESTEDLYRLYLWRTVLNPFLQDERKLENANFIESNLNSGTDFLRCSATSTHIHCFKRSECPTLQRAWKDTWYDVETFKLKSKTKLCRKIEGVLTSCSPSVSDVLLEWRAEVAIPFQDFCKVYPQILIAVQVRIAHVFTENWKTYS